MLSELSCIHGNSGWKLRTGFGYVKIKGPKKSFKSPCRFKKNNIACSRGIIEKKLNINEVAWVPHLWTPEIFFSLDKRNVSKIY